MLIRRFTFLGALVLGLLLSFQCREDKKKVEDAEPVVVEELVTIVRGDRSTTTEDGDTVDEYILKNANGMQVDIITYGGRITSLKVPDKDGVIEDIVLGFDSLDQYLEIPSRFGALIGRFGNRIANGKFSLNNETYNLAVNNGQNHIHGGKVGFDNVVWNAKMQSDTKSASLILTYLSKDGEEGYPGNLVNTVTYTLTENDALEITFGATTDKTTIVNLTQHNFFNLSGNLADNDVLNHIISIDADNFLPVDSGSIPTGEFTPVAGTPFDFREPKAIGAEISVENKQLTIGSGYDHCWVLNNQNEGVRPVSTAYHPSSGRFMEVFSDEPGLQFYTGNHLKDTHESRSGFCFELQHYPDSPNKENFPSVVLEPGEKYSSKTIFKFSAK